MEYFLGISKWKLLDLNNEVKWILIMLRTDPNEYSAIFRIYAKEISTVHGLDVNGLIKNQIPTTFYLQKICMESPI